jgi:hypothetical protein
LEECWRHLREFEEHLLGAVELDGEAHDPFPFLELVPGDIGEVLEDPRSRRCCRRASLRENAVNVV